MTTKKGLLIALICVIGLAFITYPAYADKRETTRRYGPGYEKWVGTIIPSDFEFGPDDEVGRLNWITPSSVLQAAKLIRKGKIYDLTVTVDRNSPNWPGHHPFEMISFRTPWGLKNQGDQAWMAKGNDAGITFISEVTIHCQHTGTHMDGLAHVVFGPNQAGYNGISAMTDAGDWGMLKAGSETVPPVFSRGVLLDVAAYKGVNVLKSGYEITVADIKGTLRKQGTKLKKGDAVMIRTGNGQNWPSKKKFTIGPGPGWRVSKWLADQGMMISGVDTVAYEVQPTPGGMGPVGPNPHPVHMVLFHHGIHIIEVAYLEGLARDKVYEFVFIFGANKLKGATGSNIRMFAIN